uniref:Uncharacterized protein n=1 Tax=Tanacetum cinerariifolium TaxID=118510 RepID=A0A699HWC4_TANCI|nr:hypothetical protein [Tanacetum cinerariifolium]
MVMTLPFTVNFYHDGVFQINPFEYVNFDSRVIDDASFNGMAFKDFFATIRRLVLLHPKKPISHVDSDSDVKTNQPLDDVAHVIEQFEHENKGNVNIHKMTTDDQWLSKLVGNGTFIRQTNNPNPNLQGRFLLEVEDPGDEEVYSNFKAK